MKKLMYLLAFGVFLFSCEKEKNESEDLEVSFGIITSSQLKSSDNFELSDVKKVRLTIQKSNGSATKYTSSEVNISQMNGLFFTEKLILKVGSYRLTEFLLLDSVNNTIFAIPQVGSDLAKYVENSLPISFDIQKNNGLIVNIAVVTTKNRQPKDFGYVEFPISKIDFIDILVGVVDSETGGFTTAKVTVSARKQLVVQECGGPGCWDAIIESVTYKKTQMIESVSNNLITIKDSSFVYQCQYEVQRFDKFNILIEKDGYIPFYCTYTREEFNLLNDKCNNTPLFVQLKKLPQNTVADLDGNVYKTVKIGQQEWMAENLRTTRFNDGFPISGTMSWYDLDQVDNRCYTWNWNISESEIKLYGYLYNRYAIDAGVCPSGWHIPSNDEWQQLVDYAGGFEVAGGKLKEAGTEHWLSPNAGATNEFGFTALPGGYVTALGPNHIYCDGLGEFGCYVSSSNGVTIQNGDNQLHGDWLKRSIKSASGIGGASVRCIKD